MAKPKHIIVIGAGIVGASIAWHLAKAGARVTVVAEKTGGVATPASFAWINANWGNTRPYFDFRVKAMREWQRLVEAVPHLPVTFNGSIQWDLAAPELEAFGREHASWGYRIRRIERHEIMRLEPALADGPEFAMRSLHEGAVEPDRAAHMLLEETKATGGTILQQRATSLVAHGGTVTGVATPDGTLLSDHVIVAAGIDTARIATTIDVTIPLTTPPGLLIRTAPVEPLLNGLILTPHIHMRQSGCGRIIAGGDFGGSDPGTDEHMTARELFSKVQAQLIMGKGLTLESYTIGLRPMPADGLPIIGQPDDHLGVTFAVMHSAVTLAPMIGRLIASQVLTGEAEPELAPYALSRFPSGPR